MAQHDQIIDNGPGLAVRTDFNAALSALFSSNSGVTEPSVKVPGQLWFDTSVAGPPILKLRDQGNTGWVTLQASGTGATYGGDVILNRPNVATDVVLRGQMAAKDRWVLNLGNTIAETGANAGSNFMLSRYTDAGALIDVPLSLIRSTGHATFAKTVAAGALAVPADIVSQHVLAPTVMTGGIGFNTYNSSISGNWATYAAGWTAIIGFNSAAGALTFYTSDASKAAGAAAGYVTRLQLLNGYTYSYNALMAVDYSATARVGAYSATYGTAFIWNVDGANRFALYPADSTGAGAGAATALFTRNGLQVMGPDQTMGLYANGSGSYVQSFVSGWYTYTDTSQWYVVGAGAPKLQVSSAALMTLQGPTANKTVAGSWGAISDRRIKTAIRDYTAGLEAILKIRPRWFQFRPETHLDRGEDHIGLVAQEAEAAMPELVSTAEGSLGEITLPDMRTLDPTAITYALINSVKTLKAQLDEALSRITELEARL